jgi:hypothetical protein
MARLPSVNIFNEERVKAIKIKTIVDDAMILTVDETRECLRNYIKDELGYFAEDMSRARSLEIEERLNFKLKQIENSMIRHIDEKINKITERIVELSISRVIEQEVETRLNKKLDKIRKIL